MKCPLCEHKRITKHYYEDDYIWIADCQTCKVPMGVLKQHTMKIPYTTLLFIVKKIEELFGTSVKIRTKQRKIKNHFHWHIFK